LGTVAPVGGGRAVPGGGGGTVAGESKSLPKDPCRTPTAGARPPPGAGRTSTLAESQRGGVAVNPSPLDGQCPAEAPPFCPTHMKAVGSSSGTRAGGTHSGLGRIRPTDALSLKEKERQRQELQRAFGITPEDVARAQWQHTTRDHWSLDAPSTVGGGGPSLNGIGGVAAEGPSRPATDTGHLRHLAQVFRDTAEETSTAASEGTPVPASSAAVAMALAAAKGPSCASASASAPAPPGPGQGTSGKRPPAGVSAKWGPPSRWLAAAPTARRGRSGSGPPSERALKRFHCGETAGGGAHDATRRPRPRLPPRRPRASPDRRSRPPTRVGQTRRIAAAARTPPQPPAATPEQLAADDGRVRPTKARSAFCLKRHCAPSGGSSEKIP